MAADAHAGAKPGYLHRGLSPDDILSTLGGGDAGGHSCFIPSWSRSRLDPAAQAHRGMHQETMRLYGPTSSGPQRSLSRAAALGELEGKTIGILQNIARILGVAGYPFLMVRHPIGSCTLMELQERAEDAYRQALPILLSD